MKNKTKWIRALLVILSLVMALSVLVGCDTDEQIAALKEQVEANKTKLDETVTKLEDVADSAETKTTVAELRVLVDQIKATADGAATAAKLEEVATKLAAVETTANAAATADALAAAKAEIAGMIADNATTDKAVSDALTAAQAKIVKLEAEAATKAALEGEITKLDKAIADGATADAKALADAKAALEKQLKENADLDAATKAALEGEIAKLDKAIADGAAADAKALADVKAALEAEIAKLATKTEVEDAVKACKEYADGLNAAMDAKVAEISGRFETLKSNVDKNSTDIAALQTLVSEIQGKINDLHAEDFAGDYNAATEELRNGTYSLTAFDALVATIKAENYAEDKYAEFEAKAADLRFFLTRAISVEQIKGYFTELQGVIDNMPTLVESLTEMLNAIEANKTITAEDNCLDALKSLYAKITEIDDALKARYENVVAAHDNLLAAKKAAEAVIAEIDAIVTPIVFEDSKDAIEKVEASFDAYKTAYFANENYTKLYAEDVNAEAMITNYAKLTGYRARYDQLVIAAASKVAVIDKALSFATDSVLWSDLDALNANKAEIDAWASAYEIDEANMAKIYGDEYGKLITAITYADAMTAIYNDKAAAALVENLKALCAKELVLYTDTAEAQGYRAELDVLMAAIELVTNYNSTADKNYETMIGADLLAKFAEVEARMADLAKAKVEVDAIVEKMATMVGNVTFKDYSTIVNEYDKGLANICTGYEIVVDDENYVAIVKVAQEMCNDLYKEYQSLTAKVAEIYMLVRDKMNGTAWKLSDGNMIIELNGYLAQLPLDWGVTDINLELTLIIDNKGTEDTSDDITEQANLKTLIADFNKVIAEYNAMAKAAQDAAVSVNDLIAALDSGKLLDVKYYATVKAAQDAFKAWVATYLPEVDGTDAAAVEAAIEAIQEIHILSNKNNVYVFVTTASYEKLVPAVKAADDNYAAYETEWATLRADMEALIAQWSIHSDFASVKTAYEAFVLTYYANEIDASTQLNGEVDLYDAFTAQRLLFESKLDQAKTDAQAIKNAIAALEDATFDNAQSVIDATVAIRNMIAQYESDYNCAILDCELCGVTADEELALAKAEAKGDYTKAFADHLAQLTDDAVKEQVKSAWVSSNDTLDRAKTEAEAQNVAAYAKSQLELYPIA